MNPRETENHKTDVSFNGTHQITPVAGIRDVDEDLKEDESNLDGSASPLLFLSENSKFDADPSSNDAGPSAGLSPEPEEPRAKKTRGKQKINIEFIQEKNKRYTTFSKRKTGLMKKAHELSSLTGAEVLLLVASETNHVYTFATSKLRNMIQSDKGKELIRTCLACDEEPSTSASASASSSSNQPPVPDPPKQEQERQAVPVIPTSLSHFLLPQEHDAFSLAASYGGGGGSFTSGDAAQTIFFQLPVTMTSALPIKKESHDLNHQGD